jgi:hypothetical protein
LWQCGVKTFSEGEKHGLFATSHFPDYNKSFFFFWDSDSSHDSDESVRK